MGNQPVSLTVLRDIGWRYWDPIGLLKKGEDWRNKPSFADEYDTYLIAAFSRLRRGDKDEDVIGYLIDIESDYIGLGIGPNTRSRALAVVTQLKIYAQSLLHLTSP